MEGLVVAVMMYLSCGWFSCTDEFTAVYKDMRTCSERVRQLEKKTSYNQRNRRYCRLVGVIQVLDYGKGAPAARPSSSD